MPMPTSHAPTPRGPPSASPPWWRFGMVWFVLSGPALVVVAGFATMAIAFIDADAEIHAPTAVSEYSIRIGSREPPADRRVREERRCGAEAERSGAALRPTP